MSSLDSFYLFVGLVPYYPVDWLLLALVYRRFLTAVVAPTPPILLPLKPHPQRTRGADYADSAPPCRTQP